MNPIQIVEAARPDVGPMRADEQRHVRERLFDVAMRAQSEHKPMEVRSPNTRRSNALRLGALGMLGAIAIGGLAFSATRDTGTSLNQATPDTEPERTTTVTTEPERTIVVEPPRPTTAPTTTTTPIPGSATSPLLLPPERTRLDELRVTPMQLGGSTLMLRASDLTIIGLREADGLMPPALGPPTTDEAGGTVPIIAPREFNGFTVPEPNETGAYTANIACGSLTIAEGPGFSPFRLELDQLLQSMSVTHGAITVALPDRWQLISEGPSVNEFTFGLPVAVSGINIVVTLAQYPNGSIAEAAYGDRQYEPETFRGQPAWIHRSASDPGAFDLVGMLGTTAFRVSARDIALLELEFVLSQLLSGDVDEWIRRFGALPVEPDPDIRTCSAQPSFNVSS
ncbi:hypothetical protein [Ilumatobacter sp.]|uniref:hypothetical protein n=1 Tax=Ilumatobacter sp. TaxID=1967498 RepID=UPI003750CB35